MSREYPKESDILFRTQVLLNEEPYDSPLYLLESEEDVLARLSSILGEKASKTPSFRYRHFKEHISFHIGTLGDLSERQSEAFRLALRNAFESRLDEALYQLKELNAMRSLYYACLYLSEQYSDIQQIFRILFSASNYYATRDCYVNTYLSIFPADITSIQSINKFLLHHRVLELQGFSAFRQLSDIYQGFISENEQVLSTYEYSFRKFSSRLTKGSSEQIGRKNTLHFWENEEFQNELRKLFWDYSRRLPSSELKDILFRRDVQQLRGMVLDSLDQKLQKILKNSEPSLCTQDASVRWNTHHWETAEYLFLFSELMQGKIYHVCPICGHLFPVDPKYRSKRYCNRHTKNQIQYYNRIRVKNTGSEE